MTEYLLHTVNTTWWQPVLRQLALLEQYYETDEIVLAVCANKARLFPRFGLSRITDMMLMNEVSVTVNMAMGDPNQRLQKFLVATNAAIQLRLQAPPGANVSEMTKEIYANAGYRDGARFFSEQQDPRLMKAMQMIQQLKGALDGKQMELQAKAQETQMKLLSNEKIKGAELQIDQARISGDLQIRQGELVIAEQQLKLDNLRLQLDAQGADKELSMRVAEMQSNIDAAQLKLEGERQKMVGLAVKIASEAEQAQVKLEGMRTENAAAADAHQNESRITEVASQVMQNMQAISGEIENIKSGLAAATGTMKDHTALIGQGMSMMMQPKRKPSGFMLKKGLDKKTNAVVVNYSDGTSEEMPVQ